MRKKTINYSYHLSNFLSTLADSQKNLKSESRYFYTRFILKNLEAIKKAGLISAYTVVPSSSTYFCRKFKSASSKFRDYIVIYYKYVNDRPLFEKIKVFSTPGRRLFVSVHFLKKLGVIHKGSTIMVSTSQYGIINHREAIFRNSGGLLLYKIQ